MKARVSKIAGYAAMAILALMSSSEAWAITAPSNTSAFLYPLYKIIVLDIGSGPVMFAVGFIGVCVSAYFLYHHQLGQFIGSLVATALIVGAASVVPTLGAIF